jgi:rhodanese-related sulfurtransferase
MTDVIRVSPLEAQALLAEGYAYLDVRSEDEFALGHPAGAFNVPVMLLVGGGMQPNPRFVDVVRASFPLDARLVVGCHAGNRSLHAARVLAGQGYAAVVDQRAGWDGARGPFGQVTEAGWGRLGLPTETGEPEGRSFAALAKGG